MSFNLAEYLGLVPIAAALVGEVAGAAPAAAAGEAFSVASPEPVSAWGHPFNLSFSGTPVTPPVATTPPTPAPVLTAWEKDVAIFELGAALVGQGEAAYAAASQGQAFSITVTAGLFGHEQNLVLAGTPA